MDELHLQGNNLPGKIQNLAAKFFKGLTQKSGQLNEVLWQFYTNPEKISDKNIEK